jgi:winged helix DNA-binding protein
VSERVLTARDLNRALLARQLLLERARLSIPQAIERVGGLQTQYAPSGYVGLWSRVQNFEREALTRALERRTVVQATLMRVTIHMVSAREYWLFARGLRRARQEWWLKQHKGKVTDRQMQRDADRLRAALADGPRSVRELGEPATGFVGHVGLWVDLVRAPPSGTWERRRADLLALAEDWVGPCEVTEDEGLDHVVRSYLRGFGPAKANDIASWAGVPATKLTPALQRLELRRFRDEAGKELVDLPRAPLPHPDTPAPLRFLPHWDANLLVHARRTQILPEPFRSRIFNAKNPFSVGTFLVDGAVAGVWRVENGRIVVEPYERLSRQVRKELEDEAERLQAFHA